MNMNRDIVRMRHVRDTKPQDSNWDNYKKGIDGLASAVLIGGLVQALLLSLKPSGETSKYMKNAAAVLVDWLMSEDAPCPEIAVPHGLNETDPLKRYAAGLIDLNNGQEAMAIQAEALRYLSQAKLVAGAFKE
jgi:hypothetical protein